MVAIKGAQAERFIQHPDPSCVAILLHGPDAGLVSERAKVAAEAFAKRDGGTSEIIRVDEPDLEADADRLAVELQTMPMFGGTKVVRSTAGRKINAAMLKALFAPGPPAAAFVCEAGNLKATDALRKLFDGTSWAAGIACYGDSERDLGGLARDMIETAGLRIEADALQLLVSRLGADRAVSRGEVEKLTLYCHGKTSINLQDVEAIVGDASESTLDALVMAAASGQPQIVVREFDKALAGGENPQMMIAAAQRYFQRLHRVSTAMAQGKTADDAIRALRPPVHFKLKDAINAHTRIWKPEQLGQLLQRIGSTAKSARLKGNMDSVLAERLLLSIAAHGARRASARN